MITNDYLRDGFFEKCAELGFSEETSAQLYKAAGRLGRLNLRPAWNSIKGFFKNKPVTQVRNAATSAGNSMRDFARDLSGSNVRAAGEELTAAIGDVNKMKAHPYRISESGRKIPILKQTEAPLSGTVSSGRLQQNLLIQEAAAKQRAAADALLGTSKARARAANDQFDAARAARNKARLGTAVVGTGAAGFGALGTRAAMSSGRQQPEQQQTQASTQVQEPVQTASNFSADDFLPYLPLLFGGGNSGAQQMPYGYNPGTMTPASPGFGKSWRDYWT